MSGTGPLVVIFSFSERNILPNWPPWRNKGVEAVKYTKVVHFSELKCLYFSGVPLPPLFLRISIRFRWPRRRRQAKWGAPDPGPRSSDDQGIYLACLPAQNIRPSHSPSTWARPAPPRRPGLVLTHRTSLARPIQATRPVYMTYARSKLPRRVCILRGSRTAGGRSRFETQGCAADGTADSPELCRAATYDIMCE